MYNVSDDVIDAFQTDGVHKELRIVINNVSYGNDKIVDGSFNLKQSILESEAFEAIGCNAASLSVELHAQFATKIRGTRIQAYIKAGNTQELLIFNGFVDKCTKTANGWKRSIEAYDILYSLSGQSGQTTGNDQNKYDVTEWFNNHANCTVTSLLTDVCTKYGVSVRSGNKPLVNGSITTTCGKVKAASSLSALDLIKAIMQLNGCFGYITGDGYFSWKYLIMHSYDETGVLYPSAYLYPSSSLYPGTDESQIITPENAINYIGSYERLEYQDFKMLPINKVVVRNHSKDDEAGSYGSGENSYVIEGNILIKDKSKAERETMARNVYDVLNSTWYVPFAAELLGLPYIECGDEVNFTDFVGDYGQASINRYYIMARTISGGQHLKDNFSASGDEYMHEFTTGSADNSGNSDVEEIKEDLEENYPTNDDMEEAIENASNMYRIVSCSSDQVPYTNPDPRTLYCMQGEARVVDDLDED